MKKLILFCAVVVCLPVYLFCSTTHLSENSKDSISNQSGNQMPLICKGAKVYRNNVLLKTKEVATILSSNPKVMRQYQRGYNLRQNGLSLIGFGVLGAIGGVYLIAHGFDTKQTNSGHVIATSTEPNSNYYFGVSAFELGATMIVGGIVCTIIGKIKLRSAIYKYNQMPIGTLNQPVLKYDFGLQNHGIGLKIVF